MSYCKTEGKDKIIFVTKEDHNTPINIELPADDEDDEPVGLIQPNGEINWSCPCLGGMATGPCGVQFREAFSCFHYSEADPKGSDCITNFKTMSECMAKYPGVYGLKSDDQPDPFEEDDKESISEPPKESTNSKSVTVSKES